MTIPAGTSLPMLHLLACQVSRLHKLLIKLGVAAHAVGINHGLCSGDGLHALRFLAQCEDGGMSQPVGCFEIILGKDTRMGHVAIVACGYRGVGAVLPRSVVRPHHVAVDAHLRIVAEVTVSLGHVDQVSTQSHESSCKSHCQHLRAQCREELHDEAISVGEELSHSNDTKGNRDKYI